jgi:hypothetical protein
MILTSPMDPSVSASFTPSPLPLLRYLQRCRNKPGVAARHQVPSISTFPALVLPRPRISLLTPLGSVPCCVLRLLLLKTPNTLLRVLCGSQFSFI